MARALIYALALLAQQFVYSDGLSPAFAATCTERLTIGRRHMNMCAIPAFLSTEQGPGLAFVTRGISSRHNQGSKHLARISRAFVYNSCKPVSRSGGSPLAWSMAVGEKFPSLPAMIGGIGGLPLLPGTSQVISSPSPGQTAAIKNALAFAAVDGKFGGKPVVAYFSSSGADQTFKGIATLASIEEINMDQEGDIQNALITGIGRAVIWRVKTVPFTPLVVADNWNMLQDVPPAASYMHSLEMMRPLVDEMSTQHTEIRLLLAKLASSSVELQLCDLDGVCSTDMLLELGPEVYRKAQELISLASSASSRQNSNSHKPMAAALTPLDTLAKKGVGRVAFWEERFPQFGDEIDGEMQYLRMFSFACWQGLVGVVSKKEYAWTMSCTNTIMRMEAALAKIEDYKKEIQNTQQVLETLKGIVESESN